MMDRKYWRERKAVVGIGLLSGTSVDGIDAAIVEIFRGEKQLPRLLHFQSFAFENPLRDLILSISTPGKGTVEQITRVHWALGHAFANAAVKAIAQLGLEKKKI